MTEASRPLTSFAKQLERVLAEQPGRPRDEMVVMGCPRLDRLDAAVTVVSLEDAGVGQSNHPA